MDPVTAIVNLTKAFNEANGFVATSAIMVVLFTLERLRANRADNKKENSDEAKHKLAMAQLQLNLKTATTLESIEKAVVQDQKSTDILSHKIEDMGRGLAEHSQEMRKFSKEMGAHCAVMEKGRHS